MLRFSLFFIISWILLTENAFAYVGPGLGLGVIGAFVGIVVAVFLAIVGVVWYPLKRLFRKMKRSEKDEKPSAPM